MAWWIKKKKKICKCPCHWSGLMATFNPQDKHCETCEEQIKEAKRIKPLSDSTIRSKLVAQLDDVTSLICRIRGGWVCIKCERMYPPVISRHTGLPAQNLMTWSHFFSRASGGHGVRWDYDNSDPVCLFCHQKIENHKKDFIEGFCYEQYMIKKLGQEKYNLLEYKASSITKYTNFELQIMLDERKAELSILLKQYE